jgi:hypothetical protein
MIGFDEDQVLGETRHPILVATGNPADSVDGSMLELTEEELLLADRYEVDDYRRVQAPGR